MNKSESVVAPLGDLVDLVRRQNKDLITETLVGVDINKNLIEEKIKGKKTDLRKLQVVEKGCFVMSGMNVGRDRRVPVTLYSGEKPLGASNSNKYYVFKVKDPNLLAEYLNLIFKTDKIDQIGLYFSGKGVRGELEWKNFSQVPISVPSLDKQERVVKKYQTITRYIELKKRINELFEKQMTAYYHILFDNLTDYTIKNFGELFTIIRGGRPPRGNREQEKKYFCKEGGIPWLQVRDITKSTSKFPCKTSEQLTQEGFKKGKCKIIPSGSVVFVAGSGMNAKALGFCMINPFNLVLNTTLWGIVGNIVAGGASISSIYIYFLIKENISTLKRMINASTERVSFDVKKFNAFEVKFPPQFLTDKFNSFCEPIFELQKSNEQIIEKLLRMQKCWVESLD